MEEFWVKGCEVGGIASSNYASYSRRSGAFNEVGECGYDASFGNNFSRLAKNGSNACNLIYSLCDCKVWIELRERK